MQFLYHPEAGAPRLELEGEAYRYLFRVRRLKAEDPLFLRNLTDDRLHLYRTEGLDRRRAIAVLEESRELRIAPERHLHLGWCLIDPKTVEKALPTLNEIGVAKITFLRCERSQRNFRPEFDRLRRILINSSQQCGRSSMMELESGDTLRDFLGEHPGARLLDFSESRLECEAQGIETLVIGCEGGVTPEERRLFPPERIVGLGTPLVLRSESAACAAAARILL